MNIKNSTLVVFVTDASREIKKTKKYTALCDKNNFRIKYVNTDDFWIKKIEHAINIKDTKKRYSYIYDTVCDYIDKQYLDCNYCDFKDDVCIYFREKGETNHKNGCCYADFRDGICEHFENKSCNIKSISCKLYSCPLLRDNGINFKMRDIPIIKYFFSIRQKYYIKYSFFKPKVYVMNKLMEYKKK